MWWVGNLVDRKRILFLIPTLGGGGAERVVTLLLEHLDRGRFELFLVLFHERCDYALPRDVPISCLRKKSRYDLPKLIWRLAQIYEKKKPDVVLSFMNYANLISAVARKLSLSKPRLLFSEQIHVSTDFKHEPFSSLKAWALRRLYPQSDGVICVSRGVADDLVTEFRVPHEKIKVIFNPVDIEHVLTLAKEDVHHPWFVQKQSPIIIAMGRLTAQKGYPYLLKAFAQVISTFRCRLVILGEGQEREALNMLARELGVETEVAFLGFQQNPFKYLALADVFVLSSLWEGFALAIMEAMACGVPVISTRCPSGPDEIITHGVNGLLVPVADDTGLAEAMLHVLKDKELAAKLGQAGRERAEDFAVPKIVKQYEMLFQTSESSRDIAGSDYLAVHR